MQVAEHGEKFVHLGREGRLSVRDWSRLLRDWQEAATKIVEGKDRTLGYHTTNIIDRDGKTIRSIFHYLNQNLLAKARA